ncbi:Latrophilin-like protein LAT-2 [Bienertia sinuspersici]
MAKEIGECMGGLIEYDNSDPLGLERYIRMKVTIDIRKPLRRGLRIATGNNTSKWVDIKYERVGDFCYFCGRLGHIDRECNFNVGEEGKTNETVYRYGPWMRASPLKRSRNFGGDSEKERVVLHKIMNGKEEPSSGYSDPSTIKLGPPSMVRKALFKEPISTMKEYSWENEGQTLVGENGPNLNDSEPQKDSLPQGNDEISGNAIEAIKNYEGESGNVNGSQITKISKVNKQATWKRIPRKDGDNYSKQYVSSINVDHRKRDISDVVHCPMEIDEAEGFKKLKNAASGAEAEQFKVAGVGLSQPREEQ